jgi:hypothetical protein
MGVEVDLRVGDVIVLPVSSIFFCSPSVFSALGFKKSDWGSVGRKKERGVSDGGCVVLLTKEQAGVSHCSITSEGDYEYLGLYPEVSRLLI